MLVFDEYSKPASLDSIFMPTHVNYFWTLNLNEMDFGLTPLVTLEQASSPAVALCVRSFQFIVPAKWNILVYDPETFQLDAVTAGEAAGRDFTAFVYGPSEVRFSGTPLSIRDYFQERTITYPTFAKQQMLCHPITENEWICMGPTDAFNKFLKNAIAGDLT